MFRMGHKRSRRDKLVLALKKCLVCGKLHENDVENCGHYFCLRIARDPCPDCKRMQLEASINRWKKFCNLDYLSNRNHGTSSERTDTSAKKFRKYLEPISLVIPLLVHFLIVPNLPRLIPTITSLVLTIYSEVTNFLLPQGQSEYSNEEKIENRFGFNIRPFA